MGRQLICELWLRGMSMGGIEASKEILFCIKLVLVTNLLGFVPLLCTFRKGELMEELVFPCFILFFRIFCNELRRGFTRD